MERMRKHASASIRRSSRSHNEVDLKRKPFCSRAIAANTPAMRSSSPRAQPRSISAFPRSKRFVAKASRLRHVRRLFLSQPKGRRDRWRQHGGRRSAVSIQHCCARHAGPSTGLAQVGKDFARSSARKGRAGQSHASVNHTVDEVLGDETASPAYAWPRRKATPNRIWS